MTLALETLAGGGFQLLENVLAVAVGQTPGLSLTVPVSASFQALPDSRVWLDRSVPPSPGAALRSPDGAVVAAPGPVEPCVPHLEAAVVSPLHAGFRLDAACPSAYL